jgi:choline-sulfatase
MALNSDLAATMIELGGQPTPSTHTGRSLIPLMRGNAPSDWRTDFLCEFIAVAKTIPRWEGVRAEDYSYARYFVDGPDMPPFEFLHHLKNDPDQLVNLAAIPLQEQSGELKKTLRQLRQRVDVLVAESGSKMADIPPEPPRAPAKTPAKT